MRDWSSIRSSGEPRVGKTQGQLIFGWIREARELYPGDEDQQVLYVRRKKAEQDTPIIEREAS